MFSYLLYGLLWLWGKLPFPVLYTFSDICYYGAYYLLRYRRKVVRDNLCRAFPEKSLEEIRCIEKKFYHHLMDISLETYKMWHLSEKQIRKRCVFYNTALLDRYYAEGRSVIGVLGHYGNWEWLASFGLWRQSEDFLVLYKPLHNAVLDRMMKRIRSRFKARPIPKDSVLREMHHCREQGKLFLAGFIGDQTPNRKNLKFWTTFLNQETPILQGTEKIAAKYNYPVVFLRVRKVKRGYYEAEFMEVCNNPASLPYGALTEMHTRMLENCIMEEPAYWLWSHRRWKYIREDSEVRRS